MNLHEYQAKQLFRDYGIPVPPGRVARSLAEARQAVGELGGDRWVVKAQVHSGARGKAGGVRVVDHAEAAAACADELLGSTLVTRQTGAKGLPVNAVLVERATEIRSELYLGALVDRASQRVTFMASGAGGMDIEEVAAATPEAIHTVGVDPVVGLQGYQCRRIGFALGLEGRQVAALGRIMLGLYRLFMEKDLSLIEINPLVIDAQDELLALDGKVNIDGNALFRHPDLAGWRDPGQEDEKEYHAQQHGLNYITLDGDIACMVNGAGLAMATMDLIMLHGGEPANFLDVGGGTTPEKVAEAFKLILSDAKVRAILVNIFGGIVRCDLIAEGIIQALREVEVAVPVVVRLEGTNAGQGRAMLAGCGLAIIAAENLSEAAARVVAAARGESA